MKIDKKSPLLRALVRLVIFACVFFAMLVGLDRLFFSSYYVHPTWEYAANCEHELIDVLFIGNSHTHTSIDAGLLSQATGLNIRSLSCDSTNGENVAAGLEAFLNYEIPKVVVVEMCPFTAKNFALMRNEKIGIVYQHLDGIPDYSIRFKAVSQVADLENIPSGVFQLLRNTLMWSRWSFTNSSRNYFDQYGAKKLYQVSYDASFDPEKIRSAFSAPIDAKKVGMAPRNQKAFKKIIDLAEQYGFNIWVYNAPLGSYSSVYAEALNYVASLQQEHPSIRYIDNSMLALQEIGISKTDFYDGGHLNANGMEKTSVWMGKLIAERFHTVFQTDSLPLYKATTVTMLEDGKYRYTFDAFGEGQYRFVYQVNGKRIDTGFTDQNYIEGDAISSAEINRFWIYVRASRNDPTDESAVSYRFLPYTVEAYTVKLQGNIIEIKNESNFRDDLVFAWYVRNMETQNTDKFQYSNSNTFSYTFQESGTYTITAFTRQLENDVRRVTEIMTVTYDAEKQKLSINQKLDCVTAQ